MPWEFKEAETIRNAAKCIDRLLKNPPLVRPQDFYDRRTTAKFKQMPKLLEDYAARIGKAEQNLKTSIKERAMRESALILLGDYIHQNTGRYFWPEVAGLIIAFDGKASPGALKLAYRRAKLKLGKENPKL